MNLALIFAGGTGTRMNSKTKPKQFLELNGKPIIIHTIELFESHPEIDAIAVVCLESWIGYLNELLERFRIKKVKYVVPGGETGLVGRPDAEAIAEAIGRFFSDGLLERFRTNIREYKKRFTWERMVENLGTLYGRIEAGKNEANR